MKRRVPPQRAGALVLALVLLGLAALPAVVGIASAQQPPTPGPLQPIPNGLNVSVLRPTAINVKWVLTGSASGTRSSSTIGLFIRSNPGTSAGITAACTPSAAMGIINSTVQMVAAPNGVARAVETLVIPGVVADRALKEGLDVFFYCRVFTGGGVETVDAHAGLGRVGGVAAQLRYPL